jgi:predicted transposase YdaD
LERIERLKDPTQKQLAMPAAQQLRQEGVVRGKQQGMQEEKLHIAKNMLHSHEPKEKIH